MIKSYKLKGLNKPILAQLKEKLIGKELVQVRYGYLYYATIIDLDDNNVIAMEEKIDRNYVWYIPYNSKEWTLCD